jgi:hypothetical protein
MMAKIRMIIELDYDRLTMHENDIDGFNWFEGILINDELSIHSQEVGDFIGDIKVIEIQTKDWKKIGSM